MTALAFDDAVGHERMATRSANGRGFDIWPCGTGIPRRAPDGLYVVGEAKRPAVTATRGNGTFNAFAHLRLLLQQALGVRSQCQRWG